MKTIKLSLLLLLLACHLNQPQEVSSMALQDFLSENDDIRSCIRYHMIVDKIKESQLFGKNSTQVRIKTLNMILQFLHQEPQYSKAILKEIALHKPELIKYDVTNLVTFAESFDKVQPLNPAIVHNFLKQTTKLQQIMNKKKYELLQKAIDSMYYIFGIV